MIEYNFKLTTDHFLTGYKNYKKQIKCRSLLYIFYAVITVTFITIAVISYFKNETVLVYFFAILSLIPFYGSIIDKAIIKLKLKKSPFYHNDISIKISDEGLQNTDNYASLDLSWSAITKAREFSDGYMLFTGPSVYYWLPDVALNVGEKNKVGEIIKKKIKDYK